MSTFQHHPPCSFSCAFSFSPYFSPRPLPPSSREPIHMFICTSAFLLCLTNSRSASRSGLRFLLFWFFRASRNESREGTLGCRGCGSASSSEATTGTTSSSFSTCKYDKFTRGFQRLRRLQRRRLYSQLCAWMANHLLCIALALVTLLFLSLLGRLSARLEIGTINLQLSILDVLKKHPQLG